MNDPLRFELSEARIWAGPVTRGVYHVATCPALGLEARKVRGCPIGDLARMILAQTDTAPETLVEVWRGKTLCFLPQPLLVWGEITVSEADKRSVKFVKWRDLREIDWKDQDQ